MYHIFIFFQARPKILTNQIQPHNMLFYTGVVMDGTQADDYSI